MTEYLVTVTLDFDADCKPDYGSINEKFGLIGLRKTIASKGKIELSLPDNTYIGRFTAESSRQLAADFLARVKSAIKACGSSGQFYLVVGTDYCWQRGKV